jgi:hypothetical protein
MRGHVTTISLEGNCCRIFLIKQAKLMEHEGRRRKKEDKGEGRGE